MNFPMALAPRATRAVRCVLAVSGLLSVGVVSSCGGGGSATGAPTTTPITANAYAAAYKTMTWVSGVTVTFPTDCSMKVVASGTPWQHQAYYLGPAGAGQTVVATTPSGIQLAVIPYVGGLASSSAVSATFNICPTKAASATATTGGAIGLIGTGTSLFNPYEATSTVAMGDNASYTFTVSGTSYTAYFLDPCSQHATNGGMMSSGSTWHFHGAPTCWTTNVDGASGPSHIIGIALDGYPIYGGRDVNGKVVDVTTLDACNGVTSATPEFPNGAYHYVLPIDASGNPVKTKQSSINCYTGSVSSTLSAQMKKLACQMPVQLASGKMRLPDGREVSPREADAWVRETMPGMQMASNALPGKQGTMAGMDHSRMKMPGM